MKTRTCIAVAAVLVLSACATTPRQQYAAAEDVFITTLQGLNVARTSGKINDAQWKAVLVAADAAQASLQAWRRNITAGTPADQTIIDVFQSALSAMSAAAVTPTPTTKGSNAWTPQRSSWPSMPLAWPSVWSRSSSPIFRQAA